MKKTNKILAIILAILMVVTIIPITASAATSGTCGENITWEFDGATGILTISGTGNMYDYLKNNRPKYETYKSQIETVIINDGVNQIGTCAFYQYENLKNVTISDSVKTIETSAFYGCTNLASITIPDSVTSIGYNVFNNTAYYNNESNWESNVLYIGNHLYQAKYTIVGNYIIRNGTKTIADSAFSGCDELTNITIPDSVIAIGADAFFNCDSLITVQIPHSVVIICEEVFALCDNLQSIIVDVNNQYYSNDEFGVLFNKDKSTLIQYPGGNKQTNYLIPDTVSEIVEWAFGHAYDLESITIPDSVTKIGEYAFYYCSSLTKVKIGNGLTDTGNWVFGKCDSLVTVTIPDNITRIGDYAFYQCDNLTNVIIGKNLTSIGWAAFHECANIRDFYYSGTQNQWNTIAIDGCNDGLIYATIHYNSTGPHTHDYESAITPPTCTEQGYTTYTCECGDTYIDDYVNALGHIDNDNNNCCDKCSKYVLPTSGTCGDNLTWEFDEYTSTLTISGTGDMYYYDVYFNASNDEADDRPWQAYTSKIKNIIINEGVTTISEKAFYNFEYLFFVTIPLSLTRIKDKAFYSWDGLMAINYLGSEEEWKNINIGYDNSDLFNCEKIYFKDDYVPVSGSGTYGDNLTWTYDASTSTLTFFGTGAMEGFAGDGGIFSEPNFFDGIRPWEDYEFEVKHIVISEGITSIGKNAFAMFINLESVEIPCSITQIGSYSFGYCINLTDVYYSGTENDWNNIIKGDIFPGLNLIGNSYNVQLDNATKHYDYHTHDYKASVTEPTCTEQGYTTYTCECGDSYVADYVDALGHIEETVPAVAPTCTETGLTAGTKCSVCDEVFTEQETVPALGHSHTSEITTSATHTTTGVMTYTCTCGDTYTEVIAKLEKHDYESVVTAPTCTEQGYTTYTCECGDNYVGDYVDALGHDFNNGFCTNMDCAQLESASYTTNKYDIDGDTDLDAVYEISNAGQLYWFAEQVNEGNSNINAILLNDIVVNSGNLKNYDGTSANNWKVWSAIGVKRSFQGIFDGNGYCISGLYMNDDTTSGFGLFYTLDGEIRNLGIVNSYFSGKNTVGGICAVISDYKAKVIGCYSDATISVSNGCAGGICAGSYGIIEKCYNTGSITSSDEMYIGGIVGYNLNSGRIKECYNTGTINGYKFVAGICGYDEGDEISNCYNEGAITGYMHIAGICGLNTAKVSKCYNSGTITGYEKVAGICGENTNVISNCYNVGDINGYVVYIGGICGVVLPDRTIEYCHNVGKVVGTGEGISCNVGAICGGGANASVKFCYYQENCVIDGKGIVQNGMGHHDVGTRPDIVGSTMCMSVEQFASGEICIALNGEKAGDETAIWKQNIGEYGYPTFNGKTVFCDCSKENYTNALQESYHNYKSTVAKEPTCSEVGVMTYTCSCGDTYTEVIDKLAEHNYQAVITSPSCTEQGYTTYTCACGDSYVSDYVDALGHNPATAVEENYVAPTCTEDGSKDVVVYCSVCEEEISRETVILDATNHADNDDDGYCDACTELLDPTVECDCNCHKSGITKFFFNFVLFFQRIFGSNKSCDCGVVHY